MVRHRWDVSPAEAVELQRRLRDRVVSRPLGRLPRTIGGLDVHGNRGAVAVLTYPDLEWLTGAVAESPARFPYVPGLLSFREMPALLAAIEQLDVLPDVTLCDGHGIAHPRRFGIACHLGLWLGQPTIGCAKSLLCGQHADPALERGSAASLVGGGQVIGAVVRTRANVKPVYVSVGHLISLSDAVEIVLNCASRVRLPEPLRAAHRMAKSGRPGYGQV
ncbi:MAG: endonuclease V [Anaerolineae bacterium]|nr:endonuclease V [Anaerolineae bacterium]